jgi:hypothetical protein
MLIGMTIKEFFECGEGEFDMSPFFKVVIGLAILLILSMGSFLLIYGVMHGFI